MTINVNEPVDGKKTFVAVAPPAVGLNVNYLMSLPETLPSKANFTLDGINNKFTADQIVSTVLVPVEETG